MTWLIYLVHTCDMTHSCTLQNLFIRMTWLIHTCDMTRSYISDTPGAGIATVCGYLPCSYVWHESFIYITKLICTYDMTYLPCSYVWHDSFIYITWFVHMDDMTHWYVYHDSFIYVWHTRCWYRTSMWVSTAFTRVTWLTHIHAIIYSYVRHDQFIRVTWLAHICVTHQVLVSRQYVGIYLFVAARAELVGSSVVREAQSKATGCGTHNTLNAHTHTIPELPTHTHTYHPDHTHTTHIILYTRNSTIP